MKLTIYKCDLCKNKLNTENGLNVEDFFSIIKSLSDPGLSKIKEILVPTISCDADYHLCLKCMRNIRDLYDRYEAGEFSIESKQGIF